MFDIGEARHRMRISDGKITVASAALEGAACDLWIAAGEDEWRALLAPIPRPFYQDLIAAARHHGFTTVGDHTHLCAYYPALRRLVELMRELANA